MERLTQLALEDDFEVDEAAIYERVKKSALGDTGKCRSYKVPCPAFSSFCGFFLMEK